MSKTTTAAPAAPQLPDAIGFLLLGIRQASGYTPYQLWALHEAGRPEHMKLRLTLSGDRILISNPEQNPGKRSRNWAAVMQKAARGKHERRFLERSGTCGLYFIPDGALDGLGWGDVIEFGGDAVYRRGYRDRQRTFGVVLDVSPEGDLVICRYPTARHALTDAGATHCDWMGRVADAPLPLAA